MGFTTVILRIRAAGRSSRMDATQARMVLGHHSPALTLPRYVHLVAEDLPEPLLPLDERLERGGSLADGQA